MIAWDSEATSRLAAEGGDAGAAPEAPAMALDARGRAWRRRLWRDLLLAVAIYAVAHLLFAARELTGGAGSPAADLVVAQLLFLLGTALLWRVTHTLNEPEMVRHPSQPAHAALCLLIAMVLSFSPCVWWFLLRP